MPVQRRIPTFSFALLLMFSLAACSQDESDNSDQLQANAYLDVAELYYAQGQFRAAVIEAQNALQVMPGHSDTRRFVSRLYIDLGNLAQAQEVLNGLLAENPADIEAAMMLAETYLGTGEQNQAMELLEGLETSTNEQATQKNWLLGNVYARNNNATAAYEAMQAALEVDPTNTDAMVGLSMLEFQGGNEFGAQEFIDQAVAADPDNLDLWMWRGQFALLREEYLESEEAFSEALQIMGEYDTMTPKRLSALRAIIVPLQMQQKNDQALQYSQIIAESPQGQLQNSFNSAISMFQEGNLEQAESIINEVLAVAPDHAGSNTLMGIMQYARGNFQGAQESLSGLVDAETSSPDVVKILAATHLRLNQPERALSVLQEASAIYPEDGSLVALIGISQQSLGDVEESIETFNRALELQTDSADLHFAMASSYFQVQDMEAAVAQLNRAIEIDGNYTPAKSALVDLYLSQDNADAASSLTADWLEQDSASIENNNLAGRVAYRQGNLAEARQYFANSLAIDTNNADARLFLATIDVSENNYGEAESHLLTVLENDPANLSALSGVLALGDLSGQQAQQIARVQQIIDGQPAEFAPPLVLAQYHLNLGDVDSALSNAQLAYARNVNPFTENVLVTVLMRQTAVALQQQSVPSARESINYALEIQPENLQALVLAAGVEAEDGNYAAARVHLEKLKEVRPEGSLVGVEAEGDFLYIQDQFEEALEVYQQAWALSVNSGLGAKIHRTYSDLEQADEAFDFLLEWDERLPGDPIANMIIGMRYQEQNNEADAINHYEVAIERQPDNIVVLNNLAWLYQDSNPERALELSSTAADLFPDNADVLDTHGWILYKANRQDEAVAVLERALEIAPDSEAIAEHLEAARQ